MSRFILLFGEPGRLGLVSTDPSWAARHVRRNCLWIAAMIATALFAGAADAATVLYNYNTPGTPWYSFPTIPAPVDGDLGESASYFGMVEGAQHVASGVPAALISGSGGTTGSYPTIDQPTTFFFDNGSAPAQLLMSWNSPQPIQEVRTYSWHNLATSERKSQKYTLYGTNPGVNPGSWSFNPAHWDSLATVDSGNYATHDDQTAVRISGDAGAALGTYKHLLWDVDFSGGNQHAFFREFDVIASSSFPLPTTAAPAVHLRADQTLVDGSGNVTQWTDQSGNDRHATRTATAPTLVPDAIGSLPVIRFGGGDRRLDLPTLGTPGDYEVFIVARSTSQDVAFLAGSDTKGHYEAHLNGDVGARFIPDGAPGTYADLGARGQFTNGPLHAFNFRVDGDVGYNRVDGFQSPSTVPAARSAQEALLSLGIRAGDSSYPFVGDMAEVLIFDRALTATERTQVDAYLAETWGIFSHGAVLLSPANGHSITWDGTSGPQTAANAVPDNLARDGEAFGSSAYPNPAHTIGHINDGYYGNSNSWLASSGDPSPYIGIDLGGLKMLDGIAWGRSNTGSHTDRWDGTYTLQYTQFDTPDTAVDTGNATTGWANIGTVTYGATEVDGFVGHLRHEFDLGTLVATGLRIKPSSNGMAIDEMELYAAEGYPQVVFRNGAVGHWRLGEPAGSTVARNVGSAGDALNGVYSAPKIDRAGMIHDDPNTAANFNAVGEDHVTGSGLNTAGPGGTNVFENDWTIETWFIRDGVNSSETIFSNNVGRASAPVLMFGYPSAGVGDHWFGTMNSGVSWNNAIGIDLSGVDYLGKEVYAALTKTGTNAAGDALMSLYVNVDGTWYETLDQTVQWALNPGDGFYIGQHYDSGIYFDGAIDEVAVYATALDFDTIQRHYVWGTVPEPSAVLLLALALAGLANVRRRRRR